jgi:HSP20 family protein
MKKAEDSASWSYAVMWDHVTGCLEPLMEVHDTPSELTIRIDMPCVRDRKDISLSLTEDTLSIEAKMDHVVQFERWGTFQREAKFFRYTKTFILPALIRPDESRARFKSGILELHLPKKEKLHTVEVE